MNRKHLFTTRYFVNHKLYDPHGIILNGILRLPLYIARYLVRDDSFLTCCRKLYQLAQRGF